MNDSPLIVIVIIVLAIVAGFMLADSEVFNESLNGSRAEKLKAEAEALRAQTAYEQQQRDLALRVAEEKAAIELQALRDHQAQRQQLGEQVVIGVLAAFLTLLLTACVTGACILFHQTRGHTPQQQARRHQQTAPAPSASAVEKSLRATSSPPKTEQTAASPPHFTYADVQFYFTSLQNPDASKILYPNGIPPDIERFCHWILRRGGVITERHNGADKQVIRKHIKSLDDLRLHISEQDFDRLLPEYHMEKAAGQPAAVGKEGNPITAL